LLNHRARSAEIDLKGLAGRDLLGDASVEGTITLEPLGVAVLEVAA